MRIGALNIGWGPTPVIAGLRDGLVALGYREDIDFTIGLRFTRGDTSALLAAAKELLRDGTDIFFTSGDGPTRAARAATTTKPIVFVQGSDPVKAGLVQSFARPGGNLTGVVSLDNALAPKRLEMLQRVFPRLKRVLFVYDSNDPNSMEEARAYRAIAPNLGLTLVERAVRTEAEARARLAALRRGELGGIISPRDLNLNIPGLVLEASLRSGFPTLFAQGFLVERGGLISYGRPLREAGIQAARLVDKIMKGADPGKIPVEVTDKTELVVNLKTARALGIEIPRDVLFRADRIIR